MQTRKIVLLCGLIIQFVFIVTCSAAVSKGPYLIYPGESAGNGHPSMKILWQLDDPCDLRCRLEVCDKDNFIPDVYWHSALVDISENGDLYEYDLSDHNLISGQKYYYRISENYVIENGVYIGDFHFGSFVIDPGPDAQDVKFLAYADIRRDYRRFYANQPSDHETVCKAIIETYTNAPDYQTFVIHAGDWVTSDSEYFWQNEYFNKVNINAYNMRSNLPIQGCTGNHEICESEWTYEESYTGNNNLYYNKDDNVGFLGSTFYEKYWPYPYYLKDPLDENAPDPDARCWSFDYGPVHIAILDQYSKEYRSGTISYRWNFGKKNSDQQVSEQYLWLKDDLLNSDAVWNIVVLHEPAWSAGNINGNYPDLTNRQAFFESLHEEDAEVDLVIGGHNHYYARCRDGNGIPHLTIGGGGGKLFDYDENADGLEAAVSGKFHFCKIAVTGSQLNCEAVDANDISNPPLDVFTLYKKEIGCWKLNGNTRDSSGNGFNATVSGTEIWVDGKLGKAMEFDGSSGVETGDTFEGLLSNDPNKTVMAWVKSAKTDYLTSGSGRILTLYQDAGSTGFTIYAYGNPARWYGGYRDQNGTFQLVDSGINVMADDWVHIALAQEGANIFLYINGQVKATANDGGTVNPGTPANADIGAFDLDGSNNMNRYFDGIIDDVRIYNKALSGNEF